MSHKVPVMSGLERLAGFLFPNVICGYGFKGSAAAKKLAAKEPDIRMTVEQWRDSKYIEKTQWFSYWSGGVGKSLVAVLLGAERLED